MMTQQTETRDTMTERATAEAATSNQVVNAGDAEDVAILPETLSALEEERLVPNVFRWDILQKICKTRCDPRDRPGVRYMQEVEVEDEDEYVFAIDGDGGKGKVTVNIGGIPVGMIFDSGSSANVIDRTLWEELKKQHIKCVSKRSAKKLYAHGATSPLEVIGTFTADLSLANKCVSAEFTVIQGRGEPLLGRESAMKLGVLTLRVPGIPVNNVVDRSELIAKHQAVFEGIGKLKEAFTGHRDKFVWRRIAKRLEEPSLRDFPQT